MLMRKLTGWIQLQVDQVLPNCRLQLSGVYKRNRKTSADEKVIGHEISSAERKEMEEKKSEKRSVSGRTTKEQNNDDFNPKGNDLLWMDIINKKLEKLFAVHTKRRIQSHRKKKKLIKVSYNPISRQ